MPIRYQQQSSHQASKAWNNMPWDQQSWTKKNPVNKHPLRATEEISKKHSPLAAKLHGTHDWKAFSRRDYVTSWFLAFSGNNTTATGRWLDNRRQTSRMNPALPLPQQPLQQNLSRSPKTLGLSFTQHWSPHINPILGQVGQRLRIAVCRDGCVWFWIAVQEIGRWFEISVCIWTLQAGGNEGMIW